MSSRFTNYIPYSRVRQLRKQGLKFKEIGKIIAKEQKRMPDYQPDSVRRVFKLGYRE